MKDWEIIVIAVCLGVLIATLTVYLWVQLLTS